MGAELGKRWVSGEHAAGLLGEADTLLAAKRLELSPGDVLVLDPGEGLSAEQLARIARSCKAAFPEHRCIVLGEGMSLRKLTEAERSFLADPDRG